MVVIFYSELTIYQLLHMTLFVLFCVKKCKEYLFIDLFFLPIADSPR